jgi:hypothetical protein
MKWIMFKKTFNNRKFVSMSENITQILDEPNNEITVDEILKAVYSLKNGKSASADPKTLGFFSCELLNCSKIYFYTVCLQVYIIF